MATKKNGNSMGPWTACLVVVVVGLVLLIVLGAMAALATASFLATLEALGWLP